MCIRLGATLYCLLTGRPPFSASSVVETLRYIVEREPVPPRELNPAVPRDLETICLKCLDKRPEKRYESANALGQDLQRFLDRRAILARPVSSIEKLVRWTQRNTILAATLSSASTLLIVALAVVSWSRLKVADSLKEESKQRAAAVIASNEAKQRTQEERWSRYRANMSASASALQLYNVGGARRFLAEAPIEHRGWEWQHFSAQLDDAQLVLEGHQGDVDLVLFSPDGSRIATAGKDLTVRLWESNTGKAIATIRFEALIKSMAFSDDGTKLLCGSNRGCEFFDSNGIRLETQLSKNPAIEDMPIGLQSVQNFDGKVAEGIRFLDVNSGQPMLPTIIGQSILGCSADGALERIVTCGEAPEVLVWNTRTQQLERTLTGHTVFVGSVCFLPDGRHIASGGGYPDNFIQIWDLEDETANKKLVGHTNAISDLDVSSDGARIASGSFDQTAKLWDGHSGKELATLRGHTDWVRDVEFSPNNHYLATANSDHTVRLWKGDTGEFLTVLRGHTGLVNYVVFSPDSKWLASSSTDGTVRVWDVELMAKHGIFRGHTSFVYSVGFSADGRHIASCGWDSTVRVWDTNTVKEVACMTNDPLSININMTFNPDGSCIAAYARDYKVHWWNWKSQSLVRSLDPKSDCSDTGVAVSASGDRLACGSVGGVVRVWDPRSGEETMELKEEDATWIWDVAFDKTGERLAAANSLGNDAKCFIRIWDINSQKPMAELSGHTKTIHAVQFSNDGKWLASGSYDETVRIWNANTMELVTVLAHGSKVYDVSFSPDSLRLATGCADNTARLWDLTTFQQVAELRGHDAYVHSIAWSPDGTQLVTGSGDQTVRLWDTLSPRNRALKAMSQ
jgi:eukaryotic-like serine/threonine-protein kinase